MDDMISRAAALDALADYIHNLDKVLGKGGYLTAKECMDAAESVLGEDELPSAQPTLYGYSIEFLTMVAEIMKKENVGPGEALQLFKSASYIAELVRAEWYENVQRQMEQMFAGGQDE